MAKFNILPADMKLYSPSEPKGRVFLGGEPWPGDAWSDRPGGDDVGQGTVSQSLKDLAGAQRQADDLRTLVESAQHDLAQATRERDEAVAEHSALKAQVEASESVRGQDSDAAKTLTDERDQARKEAAEQRTRADDLDGKLTAATETVERLTAELAAANQTAADLGDRNREYATDNDKLTAQIEQLTAPKAKKAADKAED